MAKLPERKIEVRLRKDGKMDVVYSAKFPSGTIYRSITQGVDRGSVRKTVEEENNTSDAFNQVHLEAELREAQAMRGGQEVE